MEHNFGLTHQQWQQFWARLTPQQRQVIELKMDGKNLEAIASALNYKLKRVRNEWYQLCLAAQALRNEA
jgi:DNA-binding CsgD family transcriptional regulator